MFSNNLSREQILAEANSILSNPNLSKADSARAEGLIKLADQLSPASNELRKMRLARHAFEAGTADPSLARYMRGVDGVRALTEVEKNFDLALRYSAKALPDEVRALSVGTGSGGGYMVPQGFSQALYSALKQVDPIFSPDVCTQIETANGATVPIPVTDDGTDRKSVV